MIRERPSLASIIAGQTCDRQHVSARACSRSTSLLRVILMLYCITMISGQKFANRRSSVKELQKVLNSQRVNKYCNFEENCTTWFFENFIRVMASSAPSLPTTDADNSTEGHFLWHRGSGHAKIWAQLYHPLSRCKLYFWQYSTSMEDGNINIIMSTKNKTVISPGRSGILSNKWSKMFYELRGPNESYILTLEFDVPYRASAIGIDNITLENCFPKENVCTDEMFQCGDGSCVNRSQVCDFNFDCKNGKDETLICDKIPENARCNFENGWCGWKNISERPLKWVLNKGPTPSERTGPNFDHTYQNATGIYAFVNMATQSQESGKSVAYGSRGTIESPMYNPTPPYSSDPKNPYYHSCEIRFFYHQYGAHVGSLGLYLIQVKPYGNRTDRLWWSYGDKTGDAWVREAVALPDIRHRYFLQFEASKGFSSKGDIAIDDISLSPECFAIGVPLEIVGDFNYYNPVIEKMPQHPDLENETVIRITTCGAIGRIGPTAEQCAEEHNGTNVELITSLALSNHEMLIFNLTGVQRWTAPRGEYYTLIALGARGGAGSGGMGNTLGALARGVIELQKGDQLYFIVGQMGVNACPKNLGMTTISCETQNKSTLPQSYFAKSSQFDPSPRQTNIEAVKNIEFKNGGGGGGGATAIFMLKGSGEAEPILIAGGGGGLAYGNIIDDGLQHGRGPIPIGKHPRPLYMVSDEIGGPGGSWNASSDGREQDIVGMSLTHGALGGFGCEFVNESYGDGGFGGGGGGCHTGGGGGGYIGGNTAHENSGNGEGGYSYANVKLTDIYFKDGAQYGAGEIFIIPAISGCGCDYRCVALDQFLSETKCLCPQGWILSNDSKSCIMIDDIKDIRQTYLIPLIFMIIGMLAFAIVCIICYNRYQNQKALIHRRHVMFGNGTELIELPDSSMELNPNYLLDGNLYNLKDLPQIPHKNITLVKALGQGAFGEVYQGMCRIDSEEYPVAIKTLPCLSTMQAETDFMMEALIMSKFTHSNIVKFIGVSFEKHPRYIILELLAGGDLKNFLREERPRADRPSSLTMHDLIMCSYDVANGCKYLEEAHFIHRDIAARNCLLTTKGAGRTVKIADFGMARDVYRNDYYQKDGKAMLPVKWMPPESLLDGIFTSKTDVWSFGILLWEIMSFGYMPYTGCPNNDVIQMVKAGGRLEKPAGCPDPIYGIMTQCWSPRPDDRPNFANILQSISYCLQDPNVINHPTPNYDILPVIYDHDMTIMRPDPNAECINMQSELDKCGYMKPKIINPRIAARSMGFVVSGITYNTKIDKLNKNSELQVGNFARSIEHRHGTFGCNAYQFSQDTYRQAYSDKNDYVNNFDDEMIEDCQGKCGIERSDSQDSRIMHTDIEANNIENDHSADNGNNRPDEEYHQTDSITTDRRNGNESTTTTDTNSLSLIAQSSDTPLDTTTNSSPNTRTCSPSHTAGLNNMNGMVKRNTLKATLSLDPSALCRNTIPYEKITAQRSSTPGSMDLRKDSLGRELPREEECSC